MGHGLFNTESGQEVGEIALMPDSRQERWLDAPRFSTLFARYPPGVVLLQACEGGQLSASQAFTGVASHIVQQQIPVVAAMQYEISNNVARKFVAEFYKRLATFKPVDTAAQEGRNRISDFNVSRNFATPVLFMRAENGHLFERPSANPLSSSQESLSESTEPGQLTSTERTQFREKLNKYFSQSELHTLCFDMSLDREQFPTNQGKGEFVLALVEYLERNGRTDELLNLCRQQRNHVQWP